MEDIQPSQLDSL